METIGDFLIGRPAPLGLVVTALLPLVAWGAGFGTLVAYRRQRRMLATLLVAVSLVALLGMAGFLRVATRT